MAPERRIAPPRAHIYARELASIGYGRPSIKHLVREKYGISPRTDEISKILKNVRAEKHDPFPTAARETVYKRLFKQGFTIFEAFELSEWFTPFKVTKRSAPYIRDMIRDREAILHRAQKKAKKLNLTRREFNVLYWKMIGYLYRRHSWLSAWDMVKFYAKRWKDQHPDWESPYKQKPRVRKRREPVSTIVSRQAPSCISPELEAKLKEREAERETHFEYIRRMREG